MRRMPVRRTTANIVLALTGWKPEGVRPDVERFVLIAAPHTTNWDFIYLIAFAWHFELPINWVGKRSLFDSALGWLFLRMGGIPVRRDRRENLVTSLSKLFAERDVLGLVVPAEGTRRHVDHWKSGFYHIARQADVPIVMSFLDYERKVGGFGPAIVPTDDVVADMDQIRAFYGDKKGKYPEDFGQIRLREEEEALAVAD